jgi:hypothetical protein
MVVFISLPCLKQLGRNIRLMFLHTTLSYAYRTLKNAVRAAIGPIATPDFIIYGDLPKVHMLLLCYV